MANYREEHIRNNRRLARQVVGAAALLLALIGLFTVLGGSSGLCAQRWTTRTCAMSTVTACTAWSCWTPVALTT